MNSVYMYIIYDNRMILSVTMSNIVYVDKISRLDEILFSFLKILYLYIIIYILYNINIIIII